MFSPTLFEKQRRLILSAGMLGVDGRVQREGEVVHLVCYRLLDLSEELLAVGERSGAFVMPGGRGDAATHTGPPDARDPSALRGRAKPRDIYIQDLALGSAINVDARLQVT